MLLADSECSTAPKALLMDLMSMPLVYASIWSELVEVFLPNDPGFVARTTLAALVSEDIRLRYDANKLAARVAKEHPDELLAALGDFLKDKEQAWRFVNFLYRELMGALPMERWHDGWMKLALRAPELLPHR